MTAVAARAATPSPAEPGRLVQARWAVSDTLMITKRNLLVWMRVPAYIVFTVIQPVIFVLMFRYVFGGAIHTGTQGYVNFLIPGILAQTAAFATFGTAIALAQELKTRVGGDVLEFTVLDRSTVPAAMAAIAKVGESEPHLDEETGQVRVGVGGRGSEALVDAVRELDADGIEARGLALRRPSLDDVFMALTGHAAEEDSEPAGRRKGRRKPAAKETAGRGAQAGS